MKTRRRGVDSFRLISLERLKSSLDLKKGEKMLDLGCGGGSYAIWASELVGEEGLVYAVDISDYGLEYLRKSVEALEIGNIRIVKADITMRLPLNSDLFDVCLIANVLHTLNLEQDAETLFPETRRILKPSGRFFIIQIKQERLERGPPAHLRPSPEFLIELLSRYGFIHVDYVDLESNYLLEFQNTEPL